MKGNPNRCLLLINESCKKKIKITGNIIENSKCKKLLEIWIDSKLSFKTYINFCKNVVVRFMNYAE